MKEENLVFIVSQPRAGSTYLQNLLSNNTQTNTCSESWILLNYASQIKPELLHAKFDNKLALNAFKDYLSKYPKIDFEEKQKQFLLSLYYPMADGFKFVVDKTPRYWEIIDELVMLFPKSKIIILKRNPINVAKSLIKTWDLLTFKELNLFRRDLLLAPKKINKFLIEQENNSNVCSIQYEELISSSEVEVKKIYEWCGLKYFDEVLNVNSNEKYKGEYGDPLQNSKTGYLKAKEKVNKNKLKKEFVYFLKGYANFLGQNFLNEYGNYQFERKEIKKTFAFNYFLHLREDNDFSSQKSLIWMIKDFIYKLKFK